MTERNPKDEKRYRIIVIVFAAIITILLYLFACNGRYLKYGDYIFDKWTRTMTHGVDFIKD